jgi:hypothetical protein
MISIIDIIASRGSTQQLANLALVSKRMYEIAIPKLYASISVTDLNQENLMYGSTLSFASVSNGRFISGSGLTISYRR